MSDPSTIRDKKQSPIAKHAIVHGRVQGVGFRYWARSTASGLSLAGWVRNLENGTVELFFQGKKERVEHFELMLEKGPPGASVSRVDTQSVVPRGSYTRFSITI